jgi:hypothetical protein
MRNHWVFGQSCALSLLRGLSGSSAKLGEASAHGVTVYLRSGGEIDWAGDEVTLYRTPRERTADEPALQHVVSDGPPLGDHEVEGQVQGEITWFLNEFIYTYWFFTSDTPTHARAWNHDGGLQRERAPRSPAQVLADRLFELGCGR